MVRGMAKSLTDMKDVNRVHVETTYRSISRQRDREVMIYIYTHTVEYYSSVKSEEILPFAATWMDLQGILLS